MDEKKIIEGLPSGMIKPVMYSRERGTTTIYDKMLEDRIIFLNGEVNSDSAISIVAQMLYLEAEDGAKDIYFYINSPGGSVSAGMAIYDTMNYIKCDVSTICIGEAMSMGSFLLSSGAKGKRFALPHSEIMIHQPLGGTGLTQASNVEIISKYLLRTKNTLTEILAKNCGRTFEEVLRDTDRDNYMTTQEALEYGLIDKIFVNRG
jgi:ATP-dependent Clp protease protease subunit